MTIKKKLALSEGSPPKHARIVPDDNALAYLGIRI